MHPITNDIINSFEKASNDEYAIQMAAYMKYNFSFFGIKATERRLLQKPFYNKFKTLKTEEQKQIIDELWSQPNRECQLAGVDFGHLIKNKMTIEWIPFWEDKIDKKSWWDTVDFIAPQFIGPLIIDNHDFQIQYAYKWLDSKKLWFERSAIIFQLKYKERTNTELLGDIILSLANHKSFFIRKAVGWALREYGKVNPLWVSEFIINNENILSPLTIKEGRRRLFL